MEKINLKNTGEIYTIDGDVAVNNGNIIDLNYSHKNIFRKDKIVYQCLKRMIDIIGALAGIVILIPTIIVVYITRKILKEDDGPLFYEQLRYGKNGKIFRIYKFRSMCTNADEKLKEYLMQHEDARIEFQKNQKLKYDPRISKFGNFIRKTSVDELPQMINILKGDMSFVGPRPVLKDEVERYGKDKDKFLSQKPGLTGYWQVNGRSNTTYEERIKMELYYVENCSFLLDCKIFLKTFSTVLKKEGAM